MVDIPKNLFIFFKKGNREIKFIVSVYAFRKHQ